MKLREYQIEGVDFLLRRKGAILADQMGVGKTAQLIVAASRIIREYVEADLSWRVLVLTPKSVLLNWHQEILQWSEFHDIQIYTGSRRRKMNLLRSGWILTNYGLEKEMHGHFQVFIVDESHRAKNRKTQRHKHIHSIARHSNRVYLATGTPVRNHLIDLIPQTMIIGEASSYWGTIDRWFASFTNEFNGIEVGGPKDVGAFRAWVERFMLRRTKKEVLPDLTAKARRPLYCEMTPKQTELYQVLAMELAAILSEDMILITPNALSLLTRLRQILVTPKLIGAPIVGGAMSAIRDWVRDLSDDNDKGVIFTPFRQAIPHIVEASGVPPERIAIFHGGRSLKQQEHNQELFDSTTGNLAICTIQVCEGFSLASAHEALFVGCDWTMAANEQAEDRLHRIGQERPVRIQYLTHLGTIEENILTLLETKHNAMSVLEKLRVDHGTA